MKEYKFSENKKILLDESIYDKFTLEFEALRMFYVILNYEVKYGWNPAGMHVRFKGQYDCGINLILAESKETGKLIGIKVYGPDIEIKIAETCIMETDKRAAMLKEDYWKIDNMNDIDKVFQLLKCI